MRRCFDHGTAIARVHPVRLMNVEYSQTAANLRIKPTDLIYRAAVSAVDDSLVVLLMSLFS